MRSNSLFIADAPEWSAEPGYSPTVAEALRDAYRTLRLTSGRLDSQAQAHERLAACLHLPMSSRQRMRAQYVLGMSFAAVGDMSKALGCLDEALELALGLRAFEAYAVCAYLCGAILGASSQRQAATRYLALALEALREAGAGTEQSPDPPLEVDILLGLSSQHFLLARFQTAERYLIEAKERLHPTEDSRRQAAMLEWITALLLQWRGNAATGLHHALAAADTLAGSNNAPSYGRIQTVVAEIALDLAEMAPAEGSLQGKTAYLVLAHPYIDRALALARKTGAQDEPGEGLALLAHVRYARLSGADNDGLGEIETVLRTAKWLNDIPLQGQAMTSMGHELAARGDEEQAANCYRAAVDTLTLSEVPALGIRARRGLLLASEMRN
jgi:tetratricopeptide (TPR) repeat protein